MWGRIQSGKEERDKREYGVSPRDSHALKGASFHNSEATEIVEAQWEDSLIWEE